MSDQPRNCPLCGHSLLGITSVDEIASCPNCGKFFDHYRPSGASRWPALWRMVASLCGPMMLTATVRIVQWSSYHGGQKTLAGVLGEVYSVMLPLTWFGWPLVAAYLLARRYAPFPERWMSGLGLAVAGMVGNTVVMLVLMLLQLFLG